MKLNKENREILSHILINPDEWLENSIKVFGEKIAVEHLTAKVKKWQAIYEDIKAKEGINYKNRKERES